MATRTWFFMLFIMAMLGVAFFVLRQRWGGGVADVHYQQGFNLARAGKHREAIVELKKALDEDPQHELARGKMAESHEALGNYGAALEEWQRLLRETEAEQQAGEKPRVTKLWYVHQHIGICKLKTGEYQEALDSFEKAVGSSPVAGEVHRLTGEALEKLGKTQEAAREYLEAIRKMPKDSRAYQELLRMYKERGMDEKALEVGKRMQEAGKSVADEWQKLRRRYGLDGRDQGAAGKSQ